MNDPQLMEMFKSIDTNGDGKVGTEDLGRALHNLNGTEFSGETLSLLVAMFEKNGSGSIGFTEFTKLFNYVNKWLELFLKHDRDGNGLLDADEFSAALQDEEYKFPDTMVMIIMKKFGRGRPLELDQFIRVFTILKRLTVNYTSKDGSKSPPKETLFEFYDFLQSSMESCY